MARQDTSLESVGAEFLVLGKLLLERIPAYKAYINMPGYDLIATIPERHQAARIQVKSRWATKSYSFIIRSFECDFVVVAKLNRGTKDGRGPVLAPEFFVLPVEVVKRARRDKGWGKVRFAHIPNMESYKERWELIRDFLNRPAEGLGGPEEQGIGSTL